MKENAYTSMHTGFDTQPHSLRQNPSVSTQNCPCANSKWKTNFQTGFNVTTHTTNPVSICKPFITPKRQVRKRGHYQLHARKRNTHGREWGSSGGWREGSTWILKKAKQMLAALLLVFGMLSTFITLLHLVYSLCSPPPPHAVSFLLLPSSTLQEH